MTEHATHPLVELTTDLEALVDRPRPGRAGGGPVWRPRAHRGRPGGRAAARRTRRPDRAGELGRPKPWQTRRMPGFRLRARLRLRSAARPSSVRVPAAVAGLSSLALLAVVSTGAGWWATQGREPDVSLHDCFPNGHLCAAPAGRGALVPAAALTMMSSLWSPREGRELALLVPAAATVLTLLPDLGYHLSQREVGINIGAWSALALALLGGSWLLWHHIRAAMGARAPERLGNM